MSEKLDGVRGYWTGNKLISRQGNSFHAPEWFTRNFPSIPLDGELWTEREQFQELVTIVRRESAGTDWE
jgi:DNA ligase-1